MLRDGDASPLIVASKVAIPARRVGTFKANPDVEINVGPKRFGVTAKPVQPTADYARLWQIVNENNFNRYTNYQSRTSRLIPVVVLTRR